MTAYLQRRVIDAVEVKQLIAVLPTTVCRRVRSATIKGHVRKLVLHCRREAVRQWRYVMHPDPPVGNRRRQQQETVEPAFESVSESFFFFQYPTYSRWRT